MSWHLEQQLRELERKLDRKAADCELQALREEMRRATGAAEAAAQRAAQTEQNMQWLDQRLRELREEFLAYKDRVEAQDSDAAKSLFDLGRTDGAG